MYMQALLQCDSVTIQCTGPMRSMWLFLFVSDDLVWSLSDNAGRTRSTGGWTGRKTGREQDKWPQEGQQRFSRHARNRLGVVR